MLRPALLALVALPIGFQPQSAAQAGASKPAAPVQQPAQQPASGAQQPAAAVPQTPAAAPAKRLAPFPFEQVRLLDGPISDRIAKNRDVTIPLCLAQCEATGRVKNFAIAAGREKGQHEGGRPSVDVDVYATIQAAAYALATQPDPALAARIDALVDVIAAAQREDGYLNTWYQVNAPDKPEKHWSEATTSAELDCAGHLFEAAVALQHATHKSKLLDVAKKFADHLDKTFGPGRKSAGGARSQVEAGLCQLFEATGEPRYLALAKFFVDQHGAGQKKAGAAADPLGDAQEKPVREQKALSGSTVEATAFLGGAAEVSRLMTDDTLTPALEAIWKNVAETRLSITGGISAASDAQADAPYDTCSAIGLAQWCQHMLLATGDAKYADMVEHELHNAILAGVSKSGDGFLRETTLDSPGGLERTKWFEGASGNPTDIAEFVASLPSMVFATAGNSIYVAQYIPCEADVVISGVKVHLKMETNWPLKTLIEVSVTPEAPLTFAIKFRRPTWCKDVFYKHDLKEQEHSTQYPGNEAGWEVYERRYDMVDGGKINFIAPVRREAPAGTGAVPERIAVCRGSMVFALEGNDNLGSAHAFALPPSVSLDAIDRADSILGQFRALRSKDGGLFVDRGSDGTPMMRKSPIVFMPYFECANRGKSDMLVWIPESADHATPAVAPAPK